MAIGKRTHQSPFWDNQIVTCDTDRDLFAWFFDSTAFAVWCEQPQSWPLRLIGMPGSGKTTLAALTIERLRTDSKLPESRVASIFIKDDQNHSQEQLVKLFLLSLTEQLTGHQHGFNASFSKSSKSESDLNAVPIHDLRRKLHEIVVKSRTFLVIDSIDVCDAQKAGAIELELLHLLKCKMSIMLTSRIPYVERMYDLSCDAADHVYDTGNSDGLQVHWSCSNCHPVINKQMEIMCHACKVRDPSCRTCHSPNHLYEPYDHVDLDLTTQDDALMMFIGKELEDRHGKLGVTTRSNSCLPPLSQFGASLMQSRSADIVTKLQTTIRELAQDNIAMVKMRIDECDNVKNPEEILRTKDRLPDNILSLFDAGLDCILNQREQQRNIGIKAIAIVAEAGEMGITLDQLVHVLLRELRLESHVPMIDTPLTAFDILRATRGFLTLHAWDEVSYLRCYCEAFRLYVRENYHYQLFWANADRRFSSISRSSTMDFGSGSAVAATTSGLPGKGSRAAGGGGGRRTSNLSKQNTMMVIKEQEKEMSRSEIMTALKTWKPMTTAKAKPQPSTQVGRRPSEKADLAQTTGDRGEKGMNFTPSAENDNNDNNNNNNHFKLRRQQTMPLM